MANRTSKLRLLFPGLCDLCVLLAVAIPVLLVSRYVKPAKHGFFCDDTSIRYPYQKDIVPSGLLSMIGIAIPNTLISVIELVLVYPFRPDFKTSMRALGLHVTRLQAFFFFGFGAMFAITEVGKLTVSSHRPHFIDVCQPNITEGACSQNQGYVTDYECTNNHSGLVKHAQMSFPSGHATFSFYVAVFSVLYLEARLRVPRTLSTMMKTYIQILLMIAAMFVAFSRVADHHHHMSDVIAGAVIGTIVAIWIFVRFGEYFNIKIWNNPQQEKSKEQIEKITDKKEERESFIALDEAENVC